MMPRHKQLDAREQRFIEEYLIDLDPKRAAIVAGYAETTASTKSFTWVSDSNPSKPHVYAAIQKAKKDRAERTQIDADYVLQRLVEIDKMDIADLFDEYDRILPIKDWPEIWRTTLSSLDVKEISEMGEDGLPKPAIIKRLKWPDKLRNLEVMGKHVMVKAYHDKVKHEHGMDKDTLITLKDIYKSISSERDGLPGHSRSAPSGSAILAGSPTPIE